MAWEEVCKPKQYGGIGTGRVSDVNKALLSQMVVHIWDGMWEPLETWRSMGW